MTVAPEKMPSIETSGTSLVAQDPWGMPPVGMAQTDPFAVDQPDQIDQINEALSGASQGTDMGNVSFHPAKGGQGSIKIASSYIGVPYVYGGNGKSGIDCSGLVQQVYKQAFGINLPRISYQQMNAGKRVSWANIKPGDIVGIDNSSRNNGADHVMIYAGNGYVIEAARPGTLVRRRKLDLNGWDRGAWAVTFR